MGHHGVGNCIANGCMLLELCAGEGLIINNNQLQQKTRLKRTWQHWRSKHWHLLDYALVCQEDLMCYIPESCPVLTATQTTSWFRPKSDSTSRPLWEKEGQKSRSFTPTSCWRENWVWRGTLKETNKRGTAFPQNRSWAPMLTAENHFPGNCWEGRRPLDEEL